jgi:hypothetical protein
LEYLRYHELHWLKIFPGFAKSVDDYHASLMNEDWFCELQGFLSLLDVKEPRGHFR